MKVISRKDAKAKGMKRYFTGKSCIRKHVSERFTCNKTCVSCDALRRESRKTKIVKVVKNIEVPKKLVRFVKFKVVNRDRRYMGRDKFTCDILKIVWYL